MSTSHWDVVIRLLPVTILGGVVAMVINLPEYPKIPRGYRRIYMVVSTVAVGSCAALVAGLSLPLMPIPRSPEVELLVGAVAGSCGQRLFDVYATKFLGLPRVHEEVEMERMHNEAGKCQCDDKDDDNNDTPAA